MTRWIAAVVFAVSGFVFTIAGMKIADSLDVLPRLPSAGEVDFELRIKVYILVVCPAFAFLGGAVGYVFSFQWRRQLRAWLGIALASIVAFAVLQVCGAWIEHTRSSEVANASLIAFFVAWPILAAVGAALVGGIGVPGRAAPARAKSARPP